MNDNCLDSRLPFHRGIWKRESREEISGPELSHLCQPDKKGLGLRDPSKLLDWYHTDDKTTFFPSVGIPLLQPVTALYSSVSGSKPAALQLNHTEFLQDLKGKVW